MSRIVTRGTIACSSTQGGWFTVNALTPRALCCDTAGFTGLQLTLLVRIAFPFARRRHRRAGGLGDQGVGAREISPDEGARGGDLPPA